jgi:hypothetical protein
MLLAIRKWASLVVGPGFLGGSKILREGFVEVLVDNPLNPTLGVHHIVVIEIVRCGLSMT